MKSPARRAHLLCGALVGGSAALVSAIAHGAAGGTLSGPGLTVLAIACATAGAATSAGLVSRRAGGTLTLIAGSAGAQALGHLALTASATQHGGHGLLPSAPMLSAHAGAAVLLGLLIGLVGHLYQVCASVLTWLSLIPVHRGRPTPLPWGAPTIVMHSRLLRSGLRMRAPPGSVASVG